METITNSLEKMILLWSMKDDRLIIDAMKAGKELTVVGYSQRGTETTDIYTLIGFTNAYNSMQKDC